MKTIITILLTVVAVLGVQASRSWHINAVTATDPLATWMHPPCITWQDHIGWSDETWSFTRTWWECVEQEMAVDYSIDRYFDPKNEHRNAEYCDVSKMEVALMNEDHSFYGCMVW